MLVEEAAAEILDRIKDTDATEERVIALINRCIRRVFRDVLFPILETSDTIQTDAGSAYCSLPDDFGRNIFAASSDDGPVEVLTNMTSMLRRYPMIDRENINGSVKHCCVHGTLIAIHPIPTTVKTLKLFYYSKPQTLQPADSIDQYIEYDDDQEDLIFNFVLWRLYKDIEDGVEDPTPNTIYYKSQFYEALAGFKKSFKHGRSRPALPKVGRY